MVVGTTNGKPANSTSSKTPAVELTDEIAKVTGGKPDVNHHHTQLDALKAEIEKITGELDNVKASLSGSVPANTPEGKRRAELHAELDSIRQSQAGNKGSRGKILDDVKSKQDNLSAKVKALQTTKSKSAYKSPQEIDAAIARLNAQVESGSMKLVEERRALSEISNLRKSRKAVETFAEQQQAIDAERAELEKLRSQLDDPQSRALSKRFDEIRAELDALKAKAEQSGASRQQLQSKRTDLQAKLDELWQRRRARQAAFRSENDAYQSKVRQEREKRNEKYREEKRAEESRRRKEEEKTLREEAALPAYAKEIEDCDVLINYFSTKNAGNANEQTDVDVSQKSLEGVKPLELRKIEADDAFAGATIAKKKGVDEEEEGYFVGSAKKGKGKAKKNKRGVPLSLADDGTAENGNTAEAPTSAGKEAPLNVPLSTLTALLSLGIPPPTSASDVARVVENLQRKKAFFVDDQKRKTQENIEKMEKKFQSLNTASADGQTSSTSKLTETAVDATGAPESAAAKTSQTAPASTSEVKAQEA